MAGSGAPELARLDGSGLAVAIVAASWHTRVMDALVAGAQRALADAGVAADSVTLVRVPGTLELPVAAARLTAGASAGVDAALKSDREKWRSRRVAPEFDALVALGVVIRGGTPHFEYVCEAATIGLTEVSVRTGIPVGFGVLTCDNEQQALDRAGLPGSFEDKGYEAAHAAVATALALANH